MDHIDEYLATASQNVKYSEAIHAALALGKKTLNKTDHSEVYRIAMGKPFHVLLVSSFFHSSLQYSILVINYIISRKPETYTFMDVNNNVPDLDTPRTDVRIP